MKITEKTCIELLVSSVVKDKTLGHDLNAEMAFKQNLHLKFNVKHCFCFSFCIKEKKNTD